MGMALSLALFIGLGSWGLVGFGVWALVAAAVASAAFLVYAFLNDRRSR